ncbi:MAG: Re/Si-specific NAD(P)(+) transhydrogenase subunit alpha [Acidobacteriota bacterium]
MTLVFVPKEGRAAETRAAATPESVKRLKKVGLEVAVEPGLGAGAFFADAAFTAAGATLTDAAQGWSTADIVLKVGPPSAEEVGRMKSGALLVGLLAPHRHPEIARALAERQVTSIAMELVPRISRAQSMDALSSQANIAGYRAVLLAAFRLPKYMPLLMTAAGTIPPARVVILGAGVAGLQAIATARRLGAVVEVSDVRPAVKEQVESLGGKFLEVPVTESGEGAGGYAREMSPEYLEKQRQLVTQHLKAADAAISTALVPGKPAPRLITRDMVEAMRPGAVIVDLAAEQGGNCELSQADREVVHNGVVILAPTNLAAGMPADASLLYARNLVALLLPMIKDGALQVDPEDEVVKGALLTHRGEVVHGPTAQRLAAPAASS